MLSADDPARPSDSAPPVASGPMAVALALVPRDGRLLLVRRAGAAPTNEPSGGWDFPGAPVALGESLADAALRGLRQATTGVEAASDGRLLPPQDAIRDGPGRASPSHRILFPVLCRWRAGEAAPAGDALAAAWLDPVAIEELAPTAAPDPGFARLAYIARLALAAADSDADGDATAAPGR